MAVRNYWTIKDGKVAKGRIEFKWEAGLSIQQKRRSMLNLHAALNYRHDLFPALDISSASNTDLGKALSAFNLKWRGVTVECWYQGSKVYSEAGVQHHLYNSDSLTAKKSMKQYLGKLVGFNLEGVDFPMEPRTIFYDWVYLQGMLETYSTTLDLPYKVFTDVQAIENIDACQARTVCEYKLLQETNQLDVLKDFNEFSKWHVEHVEIDYVPEVNYGFGYRYIPERDSFKVLSRDLTRFETTARFLSAKLLQNEFGEYYYKMPDFTTFPDIVVYSDLLLDDLCAIEQLYEKFSHIHIVCVKSSDLPTSDYGIGADIYKVADIIKVSAAAQGCIVTFNEELYGYRDMFRYIKNTDGKFDVLCLANATAFVQDLPYIKNHINNLYAMIGKSKDDSGEEEWNASQDIASYCKLRDFVKDNGYHIITADDCEQLYSKHKYWDTQSIWLQPYIDKMTAINDSIVCFDLQCVMSYLSSK